MTLVEPLGTTMEAHYHDVAIVAQLLHYALHCHGVLCAQGITLVTEGTEAIFHAIDHFYACLAIPGSSNTYAIICQSLDGRLNSGRIKVVDVIVGYTHKVIAGIDQQLDTPCGHHERERQATWTLACLAVVGKYAFQIAACHIHASDY